MTKRNAMIAILMIFFLILVVLFFQLNYVGEKTKKQQNTIDRIFEVSYIEIISELSHKDYSVDKINMSIKTCIEIVASTSYQSPELRELLMNLYDLFQKPNEIDDLLLLCDSLGYIQSNHFDPEIIRQRTVP